MKKRGKRFLAAVMSAALVLPALPVQAADPAQTDDSWIATPYTREDGTVVEGLEEAVQGKAHWLETTEALPARASEQDGVLTVSNGIITREFKIPEAGGTEFYTQSYCNEYVEKELLEEEAVPEVYLGLYDETYDEVYDDSGIVVTNDPIASMDNTLYIPDGAIKIEPDYYYVGGTGTTENTFVFDGYEVRQECEIPFEWAPNEKYGDPTAGEWPPEGVHVEFNFSAPDEFPEVYQGIRIKVIYEMYDNMPAMKKRVEVTNTGFDQIMIGRMAPEVLNGNSDMDDLLLLETSYLCGDQSALPVGRSLPCRCAENENKGTPFEGLTEMNHTCYDVGPAYDLTTDQTFESFDTYEMIFSTYWFELQMRERMGMYRNLFPWITDNPLTFHNTEALTKEKIDHAAEAGFDMIIQSYSAPDSSSQMLSRDQAVLDQYKELVDYAHSKGIDIGIYQAQYTRGQYSGGYDYGNNDVGQWDTWCMASAAFDDYWDNFKYFVKYTGLDAVEIDGAYPGTYCNHGHDHVNQDKETDPDPEGTDKETGDASKYAVHNGFFDSNVKQWENAVRMLCGTFRDMGVYIKVPAWYYVNGSNKCGIGYEEAAWSQPRHEQLIYGRQIMYNASYARSMSMSWSHVPFANYHGGGEAAAFQPFSEHMEDYNWVMAQYLGNGVASDFRGTALFDEGTQDICNKWVDFYNRYRGIVNSDMIHITQAAYDDSDRTTAVKMDTLYHVNAKNDGEKGLLWVYNQTDEERTETITVPMYYTGLTDLSYPTAPLKDSLGKNVYRYGAYPPNYDWIPAEEGNYRLPDVTGETTGTAAFVREGVTAEIKDIDSNGNVQLEVTLPPMSFTYYTIYDESEVPEVTLEVGKVTNVTASDITENSVNLSWDKDVEVTMTENGEVNENPAVTVDGYNVYRDGELAAATMTNSWTDTEAAESTEYVYTVEAIVSGVTGQKSDECRVTTPADEVKPEVESAAVKSDTEIQIRFTEAVDRETAENTDNYSLNNGGRVLKAEITADSDGKAVTLTTESLQAMETYELTVANVKDTSKNGNVMDETKLEVVYGYIAHYAMDSVDGNTLKADIAGRDAKTSNVNFAAGTGKNGSAIFNSSYNAYADLGASILSGMDTYSISMFVRPSGLEGVQALLSAGQEEVPENDFGLYMEDGKVTFRTSNSTGEVKAELTTENTLTADVWNQIAAVREGDNFRLYLNGKLEAEDTVSGLGTFDSLNTVYLGAMTNHAGGDRTAFFSGKMDEVSLYNTALTDEQVAENAESYLGQYDASRPIVYLGMNEVTDGKVTNQADGKTFDFNGAVEQVEADNGIRGLKFDGSSNYINLGNEYQVDGEFTVAAWVNLATTGDNRNHKIFGRGYTGSSAGEFYVAIRNSGYNIDVKTNDGSNGGSLFDFDNVSYVPVNTWTQITVTCDGNTIRVYNNGVLHSVTGSASGLDLAGNTKDLLVGAGWNSSGTGLQGDHIFNGAMDEVYLYDVALTEAEIQELQTPQTPQEPEEVSKTTLEYFLNRAKAHVENGDADNCVESVRKLFEEAIAEGEAVMADENATRDEVMDAAMKLMKAIHALDLKTADKTDLEMAVELAGMIDLSKYVEAGQKEFTDALAAAREVLADGDALQGDVDAAWDALVTAMENLRMKADKDALEDLLDEVSGIDLSRHTEESAAVFRTALASAQAVFADETLSEDDQQKVDDAAAALKEAKAGLTVVDGSQGGQDPGDGDQGENQGEDIGNDNNNGTSEIGGTTSGSGNADQNSGNPNSGNSVNKAAKTGDPAPIAGLMALVLISGTVAFMTYKKRIK